jgi:hypothetical protein
MRQSGFRSRANGTLCHIGTEGEKANLLKNARESPEAAFGIRIA